jgi:hypothetical protein
MSAHYEKLGRELHSLYQRSAFGQVSKREIDLLVFSHLAKQFLQKKQKADQRLGFLFSLTAKDTRQLSLFLRITEKRVLTLMEEAALVEGAADATPSEILDLLQQNLSSSRQTSADLQEGRLRCYIPNKVVRAALEGFLAAGGGVPDTSFHRGQLVIRYADLLTAFAGPKKLSFLKDVAHQARADNKIKQVDLDRILQQPSSEQMAVAMAKTLLSALIGPSAADLTGYCLTLLRTVLKNSTQKTDNPKNKKFVLPE